MTLWLRPYPEYRDSRLPWLGEVPAHWELRRIKTLLGEKDQRIGNRSGVLLSLTRTRGLLPQTQASNRIASAEDLSKYKVCRPGDLVMNRMQAWSGMFAVSSLDGLVSPDYSVFRSIGEQEPRYFEQLFKTPMLVQQFAQRSKGIGSGFNRLYTPDFGAVPVARPPLAEQSMIVRFLTHFDQRIRRFIVAKRRLIALLNEQKRAIIQRAVTRGLDPTVGFKPPGIDCLGDVPEHWEVKRLKWVTRLQRGYDLPQDKRNPGTVPVISSGGVIGMHSEHRAVGPGVVIGRYGSTDAVFFIENDFWPHNTALFVTDFQDNDPRWCFYLLRTISKADYAAKSAVPGVDRKDLYDIYVARPPRKEQVDVVRRLEDQLVPVDSSMERTRREIDLIQEYRTRLIADVVTGKLDVRGVELPHLEEAEEIPLMSTDIVEEVPEEEQELQRVEESADASD